MANEKSPAIGKRARADSVLGNRMDEHVNYKRLKSASDKWQKIQRIIDKPDTQLCLIEAPKGVRINSLIQSVQIDLESSFNGFNLGEKLKSFSKS